MTLAPNYLDSLWKQSKIHCVTIGAVDYMPSVTNRLLTTARDDMLLPSAHLQFLGLVVAHSQDLFHLGDLRSAGVRNQEAGGHRRTETTRGEQHQVGHPGSST